MRMLKRGQRLIESLMTDTWVGTRGATAGEFNDETGEWSTSSVEVYRGPGRLRAANVQGQRVDEQGVTVTLSDARLSLPVATSAGVRVDDVFVCVASEEPTMVGARVRVTDIHWQTHSTARRLQVEVAS